ncbi:OmpP1/FadL family transporter [Dechloromonas denitrificans]|uniref:OmpP1/FadL family transporter n=1 Tax=Dechloromonas denitrificans TaxID=281362 RepID=UPI001CF87988|nr:outer membrane protein transport protein [Dechloromonas denitrificans]UCV04767.1 outer membrane protein transport protein [Dechloromonas denitrificans]
MRIRQIVQAAILPVVLVPGLALATNGYFSHGFGVKSQGIAGVGIALPQDALAAATNPAGTAFVGNRLDIGATLFRPSRGAEISGNNLPGGATANGSYDANDTRNFLIPEIGYVRQLSPQLAAGVAVYGNGGMNTDYGSNPFRAFGASGSAGINLEQLFISPSLAYKLNENHALGLAVNFAYQRFKAEGIGPFAGSSAAPNSLTNRGVDSSTGWGFRLGYTGKLTPELSIGATWASKTRMGNLDKYKGLFAEDGGFDIPANYGIGVAWQASSALTLALDAQRIEYSDIKSVGTPIATLFSGNLFGSSNGPGFGWKDVTVAKLGVSYEWRDWTWRAGYSHASQPIPADQTFLNILAPGAIQDHLSLGATWNLGKDGELSLAYTHGFKKTVKGSGSIPAAYGGGEADIHLSEDILGIAYGWKF